VPFAQDLPRNGIKDELSAGWRHDRNYASPIPTASQLRRKKKGPAVRDTCRPEEAGGFQNAQNVVGVSGLDVSKIRHSRDIWGNPFRAFP